MAKGIDNSLKPFIRYQQSILHCISYRINCSLLYVTPDQNYDIKFFFLKLMTMKDSLW